MNHKWNKDNICVNCGIYRTKKSWKRLMSITDFPPHNHYQYGKDWFYAMPNENFNTVAKAIGFERPDCKKKEIE